MAPSGCKAGHHLATSHDGQTVHSPLKGCRFFRPIYFVGCFGPCNAVRDDDAQLVEGITDLAERGKREHNPVIDAVDG